MDEWMNFEEMCTLHSVITSMLGFCSSCWQGLANGSMRLQDLYVGALPIPLFIRMNLPTHAHTYMYIRAVNAG